LEGVKNVWSGFGPNSHKIIYVINTCPQTHLGVSVFFAHFHVPLLKKGKYGNIKKQNAEKLHND